MAGARPLIAVIDDDPAFMSLVQDFLTEEGYAVVPGQEERDAFDLIERTRPALVILDIRMQGPESGRHILEQIRQDARTSGIPVIVSSADTVFLGQNDAFLRAHQAHVLPKPFDLDDLLASVEQALSSGSVDQQQGATANDDYS